MGKTLVVKRVQPKGWVIKQVGIGLVRMNPKKPNDTRSTSVYIEVASGNHVAMVNNKWARVKLIGENEYMFEAWES